MSLEGSADRYGPVFVPWHDYRLFYLEHVLP